MPENMLIARLNDIAKQLSAAAWLIPLLALLAAAVGAYAGAYLKRRGEDLATRESFAAIREQLQATTRDTEEIKQALSGRAWRSQQQWAAREQYYTSLLTQLHHFRVALDDLLDYYMEPGTEHMPDSERGGHFHALREAAASALDEVRKLQGPAAVFLSGSALDSLNELTTEHWHLANFGAICTADYVTGADKLVKAAYAQVLGEAKTHLGIDAES
jgi:hypothetical protein